MLRNEIPPYTAGGNINGPTTLENTLEVTYKTHLAAQQLHPWAFIPQNEESIVASFIIAFK
jgi:hypothetical protein